MTREELEQRVEQLAREVALLRNQVDALGAARANVAAPSSPTASTAAARSEDAGEELLSWMGKSSLLPRIAALCFLLVAALILRTLTDNGILGPQVGTIAGMTYAGLMVAAGWYMYSREKALAPIFTVCGAVLMYVVVIETHARFSLPSLPAYLILLVTGGATATISYLYSRALPVLIGTLGMGMAGVAIDYPNPYFPHLALLLLVANLIGSYATRLRSCSWLRWILLLLTAAMMQVWALKLSPGRRRPEIDPIALGEPWFLPVLTLFALVFFGIALWAAARSGEERISRFDLALPSLTAAWIFSAAAYVLRSDSMHLVLLGLIGLIVGVGLLPFVGWLRKRGEARTAAVLAYLVASLLLLGLGVRLVTASLLPLLVILSLLACVLASVAGKWEAGSVRIFTYMLQTGCAGALALVLLERGPGLGSLQQILAATTIAGFGFWQYRRARRSPPPAASTFFTRIDPDDRLAVLLLLGSLLSAFFLLRTGIYLLLGGGDAASAGALQAGQTVVINGAAAILLAIAFFRGRNREIRNVSVLVTLIATSKVVFYDLFGLEGVPLVLSVFSLGVTISLISLALTRWSRPEAVVGPASPAGGRRR